MLGLGNDIGHGIKKRGKQWESYLDRNGIDRRFASKQYLPCKTCRFVREHNRDTLTLDKAASLNLIVFCISQFSFSAIDSIFDW